MTSFLLIINYISAVMKFFTLFVLLICLCAVTIVIFLYFSSLPIKTFQSTVQTIIKQHPAATGTVFSAEKIRKYEETENNKHSRNYRNMEEIDSNVNVHGKMCDKWGVMTTISPVTEAVRRFLYNPDWCVVVIGDLQKPQVSIPPIEK